MSDATPSKGLHIALWAVQALLAFAFLMAGGMKLVTAPEELLANGVAVAGRAPALFVKFIGLCETLGAIGLILPSALRILPILTPVAAAGLAITMLSATGEHLAHGETSAIGPTIVLGALSLFVAWGRFKGAPIASR